MLAHHVELRVGQRDERVAPVGHEADRLDGAGAGDPDGRVRLLVGARPHVDEAEVVVLALEVEGPGLRPRAHDQVVGLAVPFAHERGVDLVGVRLDAEADDHAGDHPPARHDVEHGDLLGHAQRVVVERERAAEHEDLHAARHLGERGGHDVGRRHQAVGVLVVLVDADDIEAQPFGRHQLVEVVRIERPPALGIEQRVGQRQPRRVVLLLEVGRQVGPRHEMETDDLHVRPRGSSARRRRSARDARRAAGGRIFRSPRAGRRGCRWRRPRRRRAAGACRPSPTRPASAR